MAISQALCTSFKVELLQGIHDFTTDTFKIALFESAATLGATTTSYTATNEVSAPGYTTGGETLSVSVSPTSSGTTAYMSFSDASWPASTITARGAVIYNSTKANRAVAVLDFGSDKSSTSGTFSVLFPTANASDAIIRVA